MAWKLSDIPDPRQRSNDAARQREQVEQATAAPGEKREVVIGEWHYPEPPRVRCKALNIVDNYAAMRTYTVRCVLDEGHDGDHQPGMPGDLDDA